MNVIPIHTVSRMDMPPDPDNESEPDNASYDIRGFEEERWCAQKKEMKYRVSFVGYPKKSDIWFFKEDLTVGVDGFPPSLSENAFKMFWNRLEGNATEPDDSASDGDAPTEKEIQNDALLKAAEKRAAEECEKKKADKADKKADKPGRQI